jgi:hypothetical protein
MNFFHQQEVVFLKISYYNTSLWKYSYMAHNYLHWGRLWDVIHDKLRSLGTFYKITNKLMHILTYCQMLFTQTWHYFPWIKHGQEMWPLYWTWWKKLTCFGSLLMHFCLTYSSW